MRKQIVADQKQQGFTIIELMIATLVFSIILMLCLAGVMQITKMYYRGVTQNKTREAARAVTDEIAEAIRFSNGAIQPASADVATGPQVNFDSDNAVGFFCIGQKRYTYAIDRQMKREPNANAELKQKKHVFWVDQPDSCAGPADLDDPDTDLNGRDLLQENMRLYRMKLEQTANLSDKMYQISVGVAYGDNDLLSVKSDDPSELTCEDAFVGVEFCATTNYSVTAGKRL
jgi:prepilin-type N-terminal cleavage/methylation domain-containing protein